MRPPIGVAAMIEVDRPMVDEYGIALVQMMEHAGRAVAAVARRLLGGDVTGRRVAVLVGKGNHGGGVVVARHLANAGATVAIALAAPPGDLGPTPEHQRRILARIGVPGSADATDPAALIGTLAGAALIVDALIGYRLRGGPRPPVAGFIAAANAATGQRVALDLPSGLDGDSGRVATPTVRADATVTLAWPRAGLLGAPAAPLVGVLYLADIGCPGRSTGPSRSTRGHLLARRGGADSPGRRWVVPFPRVSGREGPGRLRARGSRRRVGRCGSLARMSGRALRDMRDGGPGALEHGTKWERAPRRTDRLSRRAFFCGAAALPPWASLRRAPRAPPP